MAQLQCNSNNFLGEWHNYNIIERERFYWIKWWIKLYHSDTNWKNSLFTTKLITNIDYFLNWGVFAWKEWLISEAFQYWKNLLCKFQDFLLSFCVFRRPLLCKGRLYKSRCMSVRLCICVSVCARHFQFRVENYTLKLHYALVASYSLVTSLSNKFISSFPI